MDLFDLAAKITLDTSGYERSLNDAEGKTTSFGNLLKKGFAAAGKLAVAGISAAGTAAVAVSKQALEAYANYEQLVGGVETLFKNSSGLVQEYAANAYKTAGLSANQYMETVTSFSASLLQSLGGDTEAAAKIGDMAITDMADNANKMGSSMESIQAAYQGFAKGQYQLLDNLKLGYGGTKTEMERLLADATALSGVEYNIDSLADVYEAIGVIQDKLNITGTTANEAATTFSGSLAAMKSAATNLLGKLTLGEDIRPSLDALGETVFTFISGNLVPMVGNILQSLPQALGGAVNMAVEGLQMMASNAGDLLEFGIGLADSIASGISENLPTVVSAIVSVVTALGAKILENLPRIFESGIKIVLEIAKGLIQAIPQLVAAVPKLIQAIWKGFTEFDWKSLGLAILEGIKNGLLAGVQMLIGAVKGIAGAVGSLFGVSVEDRLNYGSFSQTGTGTGSGGSVVNFTQNNYSPKALSNAEIYRRTKNQFAQIGGATT